MTVFTNAKKEVVEKLKGLIKENSKTIYEELRFKKGNVSLILYTSGKLFLQGPKAEVKELTEILEKRGVGDREKSSKFRKEVGWFIGSDETLKGDTFGGIVVAAVKADENLRTQLREIGVADSKKLSDKEIILIAEKVKKLVPCEIKSILPEEFNKQGKITLWLNKLHQETGDFLRPGQHVVDKYPGCDVGDIQEEKAESKYVEVAAASILARAAGLKQLDYLSVEAGFPLPKGSTHVKLALQELKGRGLEFEKFVKVGFRNVKEFL